MVSKKALIRTIRNQLGLRLTRLSKDQKKRLVRDVEHLMALKDVEKLKKHYRTSQRAASRSVRMVNQLSDAFSKIDPEILKGAQGYQQLVPDLLDQLTKIATRAEEHHKEFFTNPYPQTRSVHVGRCFFVLDIFSRWNPDGRANFPLTGRYPAELGQIPPPNWKDLITLGLDANGHPSSNAMKFVNEISLNFTDWRIDHYTQMKTARTELFRHPPPDYP